MIYIFKKAKVCIVPILITAMMIVLFRTVFFLGYVPSESMEPTLNSGTLILGMRIHGELKKGDIIIFQHDDTYMIKRIAAVETDTVYHNGELLVVPKECLYVLGDNSLSSYDSRYWGDPYVKVEDIMAKLLLAL